MKRLYLFIIFLHVVVVIFPQTNLKDYISLPIPVDSIYRLEEDSSKRSSDRINNMNLKASTSLYESELHPHIPNTFEIDKTKDVGEIKFTTTTTATGALNINVPIEICKSPNNLQPNLSFSYNSNQSINGMLGYGWGLAGISTISGSPKNYFYDNETAAYSRELVSAFSLDANRLIKTGESNNDISYKTSQGNILVTAYKKKYGSKTCIEHFIAKYPNGNIVIYGFPDFDNDDHAYVRLSYPITKITNREGHEINYYYNYRLDSNGVISYYYVTRINYGNKSELSIEFNYLNKETATYYESGIEIKYRDLLNQVTIKNNGIPLTTYKINYKEQSKVSLIESIALSASEKSFNPLKFYYGENNTENAANTEQNQLLAWYNFSSPGQIRVVKGKFDYGSEDDGLIIFPNRINYFEAVGGAKNHYDEYGDENIHVNTGLSGRLAGGLTTLKTGKGFYDIFCMDVDEYEGEEIIKVNNYVSGSEEIIDFHVYTPDMVTYSGIYKKYTRTYKFPAINPFGNSIYFIHPKHFFTGDFNGDGKMEILAVFAEKTYGYRVVTKYMLFDLESNKIISSGAPPFQYNIKLPEGSIDPAWALKLSDRLLILDYNGDGKSDLCYIGENGTAIYEFINNTITRITQHSSLTKGIVYDRDLLIGEFNGDGKNDLILSSETKGGKIWTVYSSIGSKNSIFAFNVQNEDLAIAIPNSQTSVMVQDFNGDGQYDLISNQQQTSYIYNKKLIGQLSQGGKSDAVMAPVNIQSKDKASKIINVYTGGKVDRISFNGDAYKEKLLTGAVSSLGIVTKIGYEYINRNDAGDFYQEGYNASFPYMNYKGAYCAVKQMQIYNKGSKLEDFSYSYYNAVVHKQGLGFCGFERFSIYDNIKGVTKTSTFDPFNFSVLKSSDSKLSNISFNYSVTVTSNKEVKILLNDKVETDKLKNTSIKTDYTYDSYGNPTKEIIDYGSGLKETTDNLYNNYTEVPYLLGELNTQTVTNERSGTSSIAAKIIMTYNNKSQPLSQKKYYNNNLVSEEAYSYDTDGNIAEEKSKAYSSSNWLTTKYSYDSFGRITKETDPLGLYIVYTYNSYGLVASAKDHKEFETKYEYDVWGREIKNVYPDNTSKVLTLGWASAPTDALILETKSETGKPTIQIYYDALGREVRKGEICFDGKYLYTDIIYDNKGRVQKKSLPFKGTAPNLWDTYAYDFYDRLINLTYASGRKDSYSYSNTSVTSVIENITKTTNQDASGKIISITDPAGTIRYNLRADGSPSSVIIPGNVTTSFEYDDYGRQTKIIDPSAGTKLFAYDLAGNISQETDANNKVIKKTYDIYNRIVKREVVGELTTTYSYNTDGQLVTVLGSNNTGTTLTYDALMRLSTVKETVVDNKWLQKEYTYSAGNPTAIVYTSNSGRIVTENYIFANGNLSEIKLNNTISVWKLTRESDLGAATEATSGILTRTYGYDAYGLPTSRVIKNGNTIIQNFGYSLTPSTGNLNWRSDNTRNIQENFTYDNLNRLTAFAGKTIAYDIKGNITDFSTIGEFAYTNTSKPYAVTEIIPYGTEIPLRNQTVTYNAMMRPISISENNYTATFTYNSDGDRVKMHIKKNNTDELTRYYIGAQYEADTGVAGSKERLYLGGDAYTAAAVYVKEGTGAWTIYYIGRDYLGSITHIIDVNGTLKQELSYDAWGRLRNPSNQQNYDIGSEPTLLLGRGYTGHEHLIMFGLVNMNARLYDPVLGRFLSPDPFVQIPDFSQNYNRYSYALNNPLRYTDPNGEFIHIIIGAVVGGVVNLTYKIITGQVTDFKSGLVSFGIGAAAGALGAATGGAAFLAAGGSFAIVGSGGFVAGAAFGGTAFLSSNMILSIGNHEAFGDPLPGAGDILQGFVLSSLTGGIGGGVSSALNGRNVWNGNIPRSGASLFSLNSTASYAGTSSMQMRSIGNIQIPKTQQINTSNRAINKQIEKIAKENNIYSGQKGGAINPEITDKYYQQMVNNEFPSNATASGYYDRGKFLITDGNHKTAAAIKYSITHQNREYLNSLLQGKGIQNTDPSRYGYKYYKLRVK